MKTTVNSILIKVAIVIALGLIMLIPIGMITSLVEEREENQKIAQNEISEKWGGIQCFTGPILVIPYEHGVDKNKNPMVKFAYFLPDNYSVDGDITTEQRSRNIFNTLVYQSTLKVKGNFSRPDTQKLKIAVEKVRWKEAFIMIGIPYLQGIKNKIDFKMNNQSYLIQPGIKENSLIDKGVTVEVPLNRETLNYNFKFDLALNGSSGLYFVPVGKQSHIHLKSTWPTVSFNGNILPSKRTLNNGFDATWDVFDYNRNYTQMWTGENKSLTSSILGVNMKLPVDNYQMTMRSVKYAIIFIAFTFVVFFLVDLLSNKRIHPIQYLLVSCALVLFYTLLLAIAEHLGFDIAYLISAIATTSLITAYSATIFNNTKQTFMIGLFLAGLYIYLYIILLQESMSLLFGAVGLFIALAIIMFVLRKVDWYKEKEIDYESDNKKTE